MSDQQAPHEMMEKVRALINAPSCCAEAKEAACNWIDAVSTPRQAEAAKALIAELEEDLVTVDGLIAFAQSDAGIAHFGKEAADALAVHGQKLKKAGSQYCDCPACTAAKAILDSRQLLVS